MNLAKSVKIFEHSKLLNENNISISDYSQIDDFVFLNGGSKTCIGRFVHIATFSSIMGGGEFFMGDFSGLSAGCRIITGTDDFSGGFLTNSTVPEEFKNVKKSFVHIGKHAIIGSNAIILPGVKVGEGAAVGAGCTIRKSLEPWTVYANIKGELKAIKKRDSDEVLKKESLLLKRLNLS